ncbi:hypothetical protein RhiirA4_483333 [Rhizophagus irregularis]|uniref:Uncharacterized protein n=1 Tax=Rhizophagus irregularis TaxID=588596 RepID=A0A2I1HMF7_9GLOM|nr:hypothetical protein RhiirA4_483333 [Rhizophagus irregularis]
MSAVTLESTINVKMIIDKKEWRLPKPISNCPGYDMEYYRTYLGNYHGSMDFKKFLANEKIYDKLSIMRKGEFSVQWGLRDLKPFQVNEIKPTKTYHHGWYRFVELIEAKDIMQKHWDRECSDPLSDFGRARVKQYSFDKFKENDLIGVYCNKLRPPLKYQDSERDEPHLLTPSNELFISSLYAKQNNLLPSINHLNQPVLRLRDGTKITIV